MWTLVDCEWIEKINQMLSASTHSSTENKLRYHSSSEWFGFAELPSEIVLYQDQLDLIKG